MIWPLVALFLLRVIRAFNQTGQKFAGNPDIVKTYLIPYPELLWVLVLAMYALAAFQISQGLDGVPPPVVTLFTAYLTISALAFKLAFTAEDAPELNIEIIRTLQGLYQTQSLVYQAKIVFALISACAVFAVFRSLTGGRSTAKASGKAPYPHFCSPLISPSIFTSQPLRHASSNSISSHQYPPPPFLQPPSPTHRLASSLGRRGHHHIHPAPIHHFLRLWWHQRHFLRRPVERLQRHQ